MTVAHLEAPAGRVAATLESLREGIAEAPDDSLFHHVTRIPARHPHARDLPGNDFARWTRTALDAPETAERLAFAGSDPGRPLAEVRAALLKVFESIPARDRAREAAEGVAFHFIRTRSVVVPLGIEADDPAEAIEAWARLDSAAVFYHLIEAPLTGDTEHALVAWLRARGAGGLASAAEEEVAEGRPLERLRRELGARWRRSMIKRRLAERAVAPEAERRRDARAAMARLAGRLRGGAAGSAAAGSGDAGSGAPRSADGAAGTGEDTGADGGARGSADVAGGAEPEDDAT
jgi:hypothetical protein